MSTTLIPDLLAQRHAFSDPVVRERGYDVPVRRIEIAGGLISAGPALLRAMSLGSRYLLVADENTYRIAGGALSRSLTRSNDFHIEEVVLPGSGKSTREVVNSLLTSASQVDALVAVGSGTINDITKLAAYEAGKPYAVFGTAPSMNGYVSANASIEEKGQKKTVPARAPVAAFFDLDVLQNAPLRLLVSGFGDCLCRSTAQTDWWLSHILLGTPYLEAPFELLEAAERRLFASAKDIGSRTAGVVRALTETLILSGIGMTICGGSMPASQGEHLISHYLELMHPLSALHGEQVAVATLAMARLQDSILSRPHPPTFTRTYDDGHLIRDHFGPGRAPEIRSDYEAKARHIVQAGLAKKANGMHWPETWKTGTARLRAFRFAADELHHLALAAGCPTTPAEIGLSDSAFAEAVHFARLIRGRFTSLDIAAMDDDADNLLAKCLAPGEDSSNLLIHERIVV